MASIKTGLSSRMVLENLCTRFDGKVADESTASSVLLLQLFLSDSFTQTRTKQAERSGDEKKLAEIVSGDKIKFSI